MLINLQIDINVIATEKLVFHFLFFFPLLHTFLCPCDKNNGPALSVQSDRSASHHRNRCLLSALLNASSISNKSVHLMKFYVPVETWQRDRECFFFIFFRLNDVSPWLLCYWNASVAEDSLLCIVTATCVDSEPFSSSHTQMI